jgi:hypothetical protein
MNIQVNNTKIVSEISTLDINFPYYGWWDSKNRSIVKMIPVYYSHDVSLINYILVIKVTKGFSLNTAITSDIIRVSKNVIDENITYILRDYSIVATEQEFKKFRLEVLNDLK